MAGFRDLYKTGVMPNRGEPQPTQLAQAPVAAAAPTAQNVAPNMGTGKALLEGLRRRILPQDRPGTSVTIGVRG